MDYLSSAKFLLKFNNTSLIDEIDSTQMSVSGPSSINLLINDRGMQMQRTQVLSASAVSLGVSNRMTIAFWLLSNNPGMAQDPLTENIENMNISLLDFDVSGTNVVVLDEQTQFNGTNKLRINIGSGYEALSVEYSIDTWHHFWLTWDGTSLEVKLYLDGKLSTLSTSDTPPASIGASSVDLSLNRLANGDDYNYISSTASIDDFAVLNVEMDDVDIIQKAINRNIDDALIEPTTCPDEFDYNIIFNDPSAIQTTGIYSDGIYLYASRSNGQLLQGKNLFWESRRDFSIGGEIDSVTTFGSGVTIENGMLKITDGTVKL